MKKGLLILSVLFLSSGSLMAAGPETMAAGSNKAEIAKTLKDAQGVAAVLQDALAKLATWKTANEANYKIAKAEKEIVDGAMKDVKEITDSVTTLKGKLADY